MSHVVLKQTLTRVSMCGSQSYFFNFRTNPTSYLIFWDPISFLLNFQGKSYFLLNLEDKSYVLLNGHQFFIFVISKERLAGTSPAKHSFGITPTIELYSCCLHRLDFMVSVLQREGLVGLGWASQAFFWSDNEKDLKTCFCMLWLITLPLLFVCTWELQHPTQYGCPDPYNANRTLF